MVGKMAKEGMLAELNMDNIPNFAGIGEEYLDRSFDPGNKYSVPYMWGTTGLVYNTTMVEELLEFTKMQDGRFTLRVESVDLASELEDAIYTYFELFRQEGIEVSYKGPDEDVPPIVADSERMKQVFCNVLDNAAKHGGAGKRIDVSAACEDGKFVIRVRDYGPGIPEEELPFVKQKFYKGSSKARGSGIGLAVCDEIVRLHGGTFDIANAEGGGAVVTISLPMS